MRQENGINRSGMLLVNSGTALRKNEKIKKFPLIILTHCPNHDSMENALLWRLGHFWHLYAQKQNIERKQG